jgi:hypothetical protein
LSRRLLLVLSAAALAAAGLFTSGAAKASTAASSTPSGGECQLAGSASFTPGLTGTSHSFNYSFNGALSGCQSNTTPPSPASGNVSAGQTITYQGGTYQEPAATGNGDCSSSTTQGTSITAWADGDYTVVNYTTTGAGALVLLQGTVASGITLTGTLNGQPSTVTIPTNEPSTPVGASALGELTFSTSSPTGVTACNTTGGLTSAQINGLIEIGQ